MYTETKRKKNKFPFFYLRINFDQKTKNNDLSK